jgi:uncharacterized protein (TIGR03083 family)
MTDEPAPDALPVVPGAIGASVTAELGLFSALVERLTLEDLAKPSADPGWTNLDVVAHVQLALVLYDRILQAGSSGLTGGTLGKAFGSLTKSVMPAASGAFNAVNSLLPHAVTSALAPEAVQGQFLGSTRRLRARVESLDGSDFTKPIYYRGEPWPLSFFLGWILNELALHRWDIESRLGPDAHLSTGAREALPWLYWGGTSFMLRPPTGLSGAIDVVLRDPPAEMCWRIASGATTHERGLCDNPAATIRGEAGTFVLILAGRIGAQDALRSTSLTVEGDEDAASKFLSAWRLV